MHGVPSLTRYCKIALAGERARLRRADAQATTASTTRDEALISVVVAGEVAAVGLANGLDVRTAAMHARRAALCKAWRRTGHRGNRQRVVQPIGSFTQLHDGIETEVVRRTSQGAARVVKLGAAVSLELGPPVPQRAYGAAAANQRSDAWRVAPTSRLPHPFGVGDDAVAESLDARPCRAGVDPLRGSTPTQSVRRER